MKSGIVSCFIFIILGIFVEGHAQEIQTRVSYDTVYAGNQLAVQYGLENWEGDLKKPDFGAFTFAGGPQISSSIRISGGVRNSSKTMLYYVLPPEQPGTYEIPAQEFSGQGETKYSDSYKIVVVENPDGIRQRPVIDSRDQARDFGSFFRENTTPPRGKKQRF